MTPVVDASAYCEVCGHQHRPGFRCKVRDGFGERCDCVGTSKDDGMDRSAQLTRCAPRAR